MYLDPMRITKLLRDLYYDYYNYAYTYNIHRYKHYVNSTPPPRCIYVFEHL